MEQLPPSLPARLFVFLAIGTGAVVALLVPVFFGLMLAGIVCG